MLPELPPERPPTEFASVTERRPPPAGCSLAPVCAADVLVPETLRVALSPSGQERCTLPAKQLLDAVPRSTGGAASTSLRRPHRILNAATRPATPLRAPNPGDLRSRATSEIA